MRRTNERQRLTLLGLLVLGLIAVQPRASSLPWDAPQPGEKSRVEGIITSAGPGVFTINTRWGNSIRVLHISETVFEEQKHNFFRWPHAYRPEDLLVGLDVRVEGEGDQAGNLIAGSVKFTQDALRIARSLQTRVAPLETVLESTEQKVAGVQRRLKADRAEMGGHLGDLNASVQAVGKRTAEAFELAGRALDTGREAHNRVGDIDDYKELGVLSLPFDFNSWELNDESRQALDDLVVDIESQPGFLLEISGFASSDGNDTHNQRLSQNRAQEVIRYLVLEHSVPRHRILAPFGFGENQPIADNEQLEGRQQNRRVEIRVLINMGIQPFRKPAD